jgi:predicted GNAT family acetyltransferase
VLGVGFACVPRGPGGTLVQHIRLADAGEVHRAVGQVRTIARDAGQTHAVWWVGELATPDDVVDWLTAEGLVPDEDEPLLASLVLREPPRGVAPNLEVTRVGTLDDFLVVQEIDLITMGVAPEQRISMAERSRAQWDTVHDEGIVQTYLGRVDGRAVAFARSAYGTDGVALLGGGTLEPERGNGYYTALVHARWQDAVERGTPLLCTQAGKMSQPILERLGFEWLGAIRLLVDRL